LLAADSELWLPRSLTGDDAERFAAVLAAAKRCPRELIDALVETELSRFCGQNCADFFASLFSNLAPLLVESKASLIKLLLFRLSRNETAAGGIPSFCEFARENLCHEEISAVFETGKAAVPGLRAENTVAFAQAMQAVRVKEPDGGREFLTELGEIAAREANEEKCSIVTAGIQLESMKCIEQRTPFVIEDLAECEDHFEKVYRFGNRERLGIKGHFALTITEIVRPQFRKCFLVSKDLFVALIVNANQEVGAEIGKLYKKVALRRIWSENWNLQDGELVIIFLIVKFE
jgi:hypothetical protein